MSYDEIYSKLKNVGQEQLLDFYDELNDEEKENLLKQIEKIDFSILDLINHQNEEKKKGVITPLKGSLQNLSAKPAVCMSAEAISMAREAKDFCA